ncbi:MAG: hypothetical protein RJA22_460 [Verrucomicrobiota bacterium]
MWLHVACRGNLGMAAWRQTVLPPVNSLPPPLPPPPRRRWRRLRILVLLGGGALGLLAVGAGLWAAEGRPGQGSMLAWFLEWSSRTEASRVPGLAQAARPWPPKGAEVALTDAAGLRTAADLYRTTNILAAQFHFTRAQWDALEPERIGALPNFLQPDGGILLRNPQAQRSGLAGVLGWEFHWSTGAVTLGGRRFTNAAVRVKGNGTYLSSLHGNKRSFKVDLNRNVRGQKLGEVDELNFHNLLNDASCLSDALGYEFYRAAGVPASRTAYAYLDVTVDGKWDRQPLGLYALVEPVDEAFVAERFGSKRTPLFKPVTYQLFEDLGADWAAYADIYDLKTEATDAEKRRVMELARLVSHAGDAEFARRIGGFLDLDAFARFLACEVLLSNHDGFLADGQNFYVYLDPATQRFGFIPWDLDLSWGGFFLLGTPRERERASIWHPWVGRHRFLERVLGVEDFRGRYRRQLEDLLGRLLVPQRLQARIDELAEVVRGPVAAESDFRRRRFEQAVMERPVPPPTGRAEGANRPVHQLKRFINARAESVRAQLDGQEEGVILRRTPRRGR